jgi:hypothetical protein
MNSKTVTRPFVRTLLFALVLFLTSTALMAQVSVSINIAPPPLPVYAQPIAPGPGFIWTPGYWAYGADGYFWVPGTWVRAPFVGALWTPGYWGWRGGYYLWNAGYWGPRVGFYGGVNYGFGYIGTGYHGGYWNNGVFNYNTAVNNINVTNIHNTYNRTVVENTTASRVSYHGGTGGIVAEPNAEERLAERDHHTYATPVQLRHEQAAGSNRAQLASVNHGTPALAATPRPAVNDRRHGAARGVDAAGSVPNGDKHGASATRVAGAQVGNDGEPGRGNPHHSGGVSNGQSGAHPPNQAQGAHHGGEHQEEGQHAR